MSCDRCGLDLWGECQCHVWDIEKRVEILEEELHKLTMIVASISKYVTRNENG